jgi:hypothetical protein
MKTRLFSANVTPFVHGYALTIGVVSVRMSVDICGPSIAFFTLWMVGKNMRDRGNKKLLAVYPAMCPWSRDVSSIETNLYDATCQPHCS